MCQSLSGSQAPLQHDEDAAPCFMMHKADQQDSACSGAHTIQLLAPSKLPDQCLCSAEDCLLDLLPASFKPSCCAGAACLLG